MKLLKKIGYGLGEMGLVVPYFAVNFYFLYFLTDLVFMDPFLAGIVVFIGKFLDGASDPFIGVMSDKTRSRFGKKRVYILFSAIPFAVSFILLWLIPPSINPWVQFVLAVLAIILYASTYSLCEVPYLALIPILSNDYDERTQIVGIKAMLSTIGTILGAGLAVLLPRCDNMLLGLRLMGLGLGISAAILLFVAAISVRKEDQTSITGIFDETTKKENTKEPVSNPSTIPIEEQKKEVNNGETYSLKQYILLLKDKNVVILLIMKMVGALATSILIAVLPYVAEYIIIDQTLGAIGLAIYILITVGCIPLWNFLSKWFDKRRLLLIGLTVFSAILIPLAFIISRDMLVVYYIGCGLLGIFMASYLIIAYSLVPDLVEYYEYKKGERHEAIFFGLWNTSHQIGAGLGGLLLGSFLKYFDYNAELSVQPDRAILGLRL
ncbi:MAG: MFS transporter, partial [Asgard group archaeon]|nr:MFS transporter [Asgard group archaeon]